MKEKKENEIDKTWSEDKIKIFYKEQIRDKFYEDIKHIKSTYSDSMEEQYHERLRNIIEEYEITFTTEQTFYEKFRDDEEKTVNKAIELRRGIIRIKLELLKKHFSEIMTEKDLFLINAYINSLDYSLKDGEKVMKRLKKQNPEQFAKEAFEERWEYHMFVLDGSEHDYEKLFQSFQKTTKDFACKLYIRSEVPHYDLNKYVNSYIYIYSTTQRTFFNPHRQPKLYYVSPEQGMIELDFESKEFEKKLTDSQNIFPEFKKKYLKGDDELILNLTLYEDLIASTLKTKPGKGGSEYKSFK